MSMKKMLAVVAAASLVAVAAPAFAANPFSDVPMNHWAYDAVEQLSAKGILEGYPNGTFKGNRAMTRYEIATMVARMMANGVGGADADKLKALIVEFAPELEALGVKVDGFDGRLSKLEKGLGGLRIWGQMRYDYTTFDDQDGVATTKSGWNFNRARIFMRKELSNGVSWDMRWHNDKIDRYFLTAKDFLGAKGLTAKLGQFATGWEFEDGLHQYNLIWDDEAAFYNGTVRGVDLKYNRGGFTVEGFYSTDNGAGTTGVYTATSGGEFYGARLKFEGEKFFVSANLYAFNNVDSTTSEVVYDENGPVMEQDAKGNWSPKTKSTTTFGTNYKTYWFALGFKPVKGLKLTGAYYINDVENIGNNVPEVDDAKMWKVILDVDQSVLKFTNLRVEYADYDKGWIQSNGAGMFTINETNYAVNKMGSNTPLEEDMKFLKVSAIQKWGQKFQTYERYGHYDQDVYGKAKEWTVGLGYQYTPNLGFYIDYTKFDGRINAGKVDSKYDNNVIRFRTLLNF